MLICTSRIIAEPGPPEDAVIYYSKHPTLADDLGRCVRRVQRSDASHPAVRLSVRSTGKSEWQWRVSERLTEADIAAMVASGQEGVSKVALAEQFKVSHSSVKRILKAHGVTYGTGHDKR